MKNLSFLFLAALALPLHADSLPQLRATLARFQGSSPVAGTVELQLTQVSKEDDEKKSAQARASATFDSSARGLNVNYPPALLERAREEDAAHDADPEATTPTRSALGRLQVLELAEMLNAAERLQRELQYAKLVEEKNASVDGKPAHLYRFALDPRLSKAEKKHVKSSDLRLTLWTTPDSIPLRADYVLKIKASFLVIGMESQQTESLIFLPHNDRLVAVRKSSQRAGSGLGQSFDSTVVTTLKLN